MNFEEAVKEMKKEIIRQLEIKFGPLVHKDSGRLFFGTEETKRCSITHRRLNNLAKEWIKEVYTECLDKSFQRSQDIIFGECK